MDTKHLEETRLIMKVNETRGSKKRTQSYTWQAEIRRAAEIDE